LGKDLVVFGMRPYPDPGDPAFDIHTERAVMITDAYGPKFADSLQM
jgi:hypothetical protein